MTAIPGGRSCHKLVAETAKEMAGCAVDEMLKDNSIYERAKTLNPDLTIPQLHAKLVSSTWPALVEQARATLAKLLAGPLAPELKDQIASALILDNTLMGRKRGGGSRLG